MCTDISVTEPLCGTGGNKRSMEIMEFTVFRFRGQRPGESCSLASWDLCLASVLFPHGVVYQALVNLLHVRRAYPIAPELHQDCTLAVSFIIVVATPVSHWQVAGLLTAQSYHRTRYFQLWDCNVHCITSIIPYLIATEPVHTYPLQLATE